VTLGSYRGFYLLNWLVRAIKEGYTDPVSIIFGLVQTALYVDFAWVYWTRQRVKLRGGAVVDSDDLSKSWLVKRLIGNANGGGDEGDEDEEAGTATFNHHGNSNGGGDMPPRQKQASNNRWGKTGISISADDGVHEVEAQRQGRDHLMDPSRFEDGESDDDDGGDVDNVPAQRHAAETLSPSYQDHGGGSSDNDVDTKLPQHRTPDPHIEGLSDGSEWREEEPH